MSRAMESAFDDGKALRQMEAAVVEERQIVSFKWVAREFEVNARKARSLLEDLAKGKLSDNALQSVDEAAWEQAMVGILDYRDRCVLCSKHLGTQVPEATHKP